MTVLVDSDVLIEVNRGKNAEILARWSELSESDSVVLYSPVSVTELWHGARPGDYPVLRRLFDSLGCVPIDHQTAQRAGNYLREYRRSHNVGLGDALIAAAAVEHGALLWTRNRKHYPMKGIRLY